MTRRSSSLFNGAERSHSDARRGEGHDRTRRQVRYEDIKVVKDDIHPLAVEANAHVHRIVTGLRQQFIDAR